MNAKDGDDEICYPYIRSFHQRANSGSEMASKFLPWMSESFKFTFLKMFSLAFHCCNF